MEVGDVVNQWPILLIFIGGMAVAMGWNKLGRKNSHDHSDLRAFIGSGFEDVKDRIGEVRDDLHSHETEDRARFGRLEGHLLWDGEDRRGRHGEGKHAK